MALLAPASGLMIGHIIVDDRTRPTDMGPLTNAESDGHGRTRNDTDKCASRDLPRHAAVDEGKLQIKTALSHDPL